MLYIIYLPTTNSCYPPIHEVLMVPQFHLIQGCLSCHFKADYLAVTQGAFHKN